MLSCSIFLYKNKNDTKNNAQGELKVERLNLKVLFLVTQHWIPNLIVKVIQGEKGLGVKVFMERAGSKVVSLAITETAISWPTDL